jgi:hypothetical protein
MQSMSRGYTDVDELVSNVDSTQDCRGEEVRHVSLNSQIHLLLCLKGYYQKSKRQHTKSETILEDLILGRVYGPECTLLVIRKCKSKPHEPGGDSCLQSQLQWRWRLGDQGLRLVLAKSYQESISTIKKARHVGVPLSFQL